MQPLGYAGVTLDENTLPKEISSAIMIHNRNVEDIRKLRAVFKGEHDILKRGKDDVDRFVNNMVVINYANAFTRQIVGYTYPDGIQFVQNDEKYMADVEKINRFMKAEDKNTLDKIMADEQSIFGTHYRAILPDAIMPDETPFEIVNLNPDYTLVVYSSYNTQTPVYGCTFYPVLEGQTVTGYVYQIYTSNMCYTYKSISTFGVQAQDFVSAKPHILRSVPIIEYANNEFRMGDWEMAVELFNSINNMASDSLNDVTQTVLSYLVLFGVATPTPEEFAEMKKNRTMTFPGAPGVTQNAKFLTAQLDGSSADLLRTYLENALRVVVGIPDRNSSGGGDTGAAIDAKNGWREIDTVARNKTMFTEAAERKLLRIALQILSPKYVSSDLTVVDVDIKIPRNKSDNLQTKTQAALNMSQIGMAKVDIVEVLDTTTDHEGQVKRWEASELVKQAQAAELAKVQAKQPATTEPAKPSQPVQPKSVDNSQKQ